MLDWLKNAWNWAGNSFDAIAKWVSGLFATLYTYVDNWITQIIRGIQDVANYVTAVYKILVKFGQSIYNILIGYINRIYNDIQRWVSQLWNQLWKYIQDVYQWAARLIDYLKKLIETSIQSLVNWVIRYIWTPLYNLAMGAWNWITTYGYQAYYLVTHPDALATLLGRYLLSSWLSLMKRYARPIGKWLLHSMISSASGVGSVIEDIITAIL